MVELNQYIFYAVKYGLRLGNDMNMVSCWLGHVNINHTHIYLEINREIQRQMLEKAGAHESVLFYS